LLTCSFADAQARPYDDRLKEIACSLLDVMIL